MSQRSSYKCNTLLSLTCILAFSPSLLSITISRVINQALMCNTDFHGVNTPALTSLNVNLGETAVHHYTGRHPKGYVEKKNCQGIDNSNGVK